MDKEYFQQLAAYNKWANEKLYEAVSTLSAAEFCQDCGVFFKNLQGTLNHILVGDTAWLTRLDAKPPVSLKLDDILYPDFVDLRRARIQKDDEIIRYCDGLDDAILATDLTYKSITAGQYTAPRKMVLGHVFNHQTHHRAHAHACLTQLGKPAPDMDLIYFTLGF